MQFKVTRRTVLASSAALLMTVAPAFADWRGELGTFRIGILDAEASKLSPGELERIRAGYADALKMPAEIYRARDLPALIDALISGRVDYAMLTAAAYASASIACACVEPIANAVMADQSTGTRAVLFLAQGMALGDMAGSKGIAVPGKNAFNSYGAALASLSTLQPVFNPSAPWIQASGSIEAAIQAFATGTADGFIIPVPATRPFGEELPAGDPVAEEVAKAGRAVSAMWRSDVIANGPHAVRQNLAGEAKTILADYLEKLATTDPDLNDILLPEGAISFRKVNAAAYASALQTAKALAASSSPPAP